MRSEGKIRHQLKQVVYRHLQKILRANFKQLPETCAHNRQEAVGREWVGVCMFVPPKGPGPRRVMCETRVGGIEQARECPWWAPHKDKETIKEEFRSLLASGDRGRIAAKYPDVAALLWVLDAPEDKDTLLEDLPSGESSNE